MEKMFLKRVFYRERNQIIIGLSGRRRSGKSVLASWLQKNKNFEIHTVARKIKDMCNNLFSLTEEHEEALKETPMPEWGNLTRRRILQVVGTDMFRNQFFERMRLESELSFWILLLDRSLAGNKNNIVFSDVRFPDEVEYVHKLGGVVIEVQRPSKEIPEQRKEVLEHSSEQKLSDIDYTILNNGTLEELYENFEELLKKIWRENI